MEHYVFNVKKMDHIYTKAISKRVINDTDGFILKCEWTLWIQNRWLNQTKKQRTVSASTHHFIDSLQTSLESQCNLSCWPIYWLSWSHDHHTWHWLEQSRLHFWIYSLHERGPSISRDNIPPWPPVRPSPVDLTLGSWPFDRSGTFSPSHFCSFVFKGSSRRSDTRGCRSSSSEIANTGTVTWSSSPLNSLPWTCWPEGALVVSESWFGDVFPFVAVNPCCLLDSDVPESRPKHGALKRARRRLLVELSRRWRCAGWVSGYEALLMKEESSGLCRGASERIFALPPSVDVLGSP